MKKKVRLDPAQAKKLIDAGFPVEVEYFAYLDILSEALPGFGEEPTGTKKNKSRGTGKRTTPPRPIIRGDDALMVLTTRKLNLREIFPHAATKEAALSHYASQVIIYMQKQPGPVKRGDLAEWLASCMPPTVKDAPQSAKSYLSRFYQLGILDIIKSKGK